MGWTENVRREVLPNGLTLLVQRQATAPVAAVITHVKAGFFDEPDHWAGVSHVLEHMFFKGTPTRGPGRIAQDTKAVGGYLNAGTSYDYTTYYVVLPAGAVASAIDIQADALQHASIDSDELRRELQVIIQEAKRKKDSPSALTTETLFELMFDRHRIRRWRIGHEDDLANLTRDDIAGYYRSRYVPRNTIVSVVGDVDVDAVLAQARERYASWEDRTPAHDPSPSESPGSEARVRTLRGDVAQAQLAIGWHGVPPLHDDAPTLELAAAILSHGRGSPLYRRLRATGIVSSVSAFSFAPTEVGIFGIGAEADPGRLPEVLDGVGAALADLRANGPASADLDRARTLLLTRWARRLEAMDGRASALAAAEALGDFTLLDEEYQRLQEVTAESVHAAVCRYADPAAAAAVAYLPDGRGGDLQVEDVVMRLGGSAGRDLPPMEPIGPRAPTAIHVPVQTHEVASLVTLPGVDLALRRKPGGATVTLGVYWARTPTETPTDAGREALGVRSAIRGVEGHDAAAVADAFERLGGSVSPTLSGDRAGFECTVLAEHAAVAAAMLRRLVDEASFLEEEVDRERVVMIDEARRRTDDMFRYPFELAFGAAFTDRGYGVPALGTERSLEQLEAAPVRQRHRERVAAARLFVVAVGDLHPERLAEQLAASFCDRPEAVAAPRAAVFGPEAGQQPRVAERQKAQTAMALVHPGYHRSDPGRYTGEVWASLASGLGGRLFETLRSQQSLAYTVLASSWQRRSAGALVSYIATSPEREEEAREGLHRELSRYGAEPVTSDELVRSVNYIVGQRQVARQSSNAVAGELVDAWFAGEGLEELIDPEARYRAVTAEMVMEMAGRFLRPELAVEGVVRGRS
jgi:zinc protease